jgi:hypothetical protein
MSLRPARAVVLLLAVAGSSPALGDDFERLEGPALAKLSARPDAKSHEQLTIAEIGQLPVVLRDTRSALIVARTDQGNLCRLLAVPALRKPPGGGEPIPVLVLERFTTFEAGSANRRLARGGDLLLFDGFRVDLDSGQVVPDGQGGDLQFLVGGRLGPRLVTLADAKMFTVSTSPIPPAQKPPAPSPGRTVVPGDFAGHYRLFANGQWSGTLELTVDEQGVIGGSFRSDLQGAVFPVTGHVAPDAPQKATFTVNYPRARHDFEAYLWTDGKGAMAGTVAMLERTFGFFAIREGGRFAPEGVEVRALVEGAEQPGRAVVEPQLGGRCLFAGEEVDLPALTAALRAAAEERPETWALLRVPDDLPYVALRRVIEAVQSARIETIRFAPARGGIELAPP